MLVLTRKTDDAIMIGDDIEVSVLSVVGDKVRIGITAPRSVSVHRREVYDEIQAERAAEPIAVMTVATDAGPLVVEVPEGSIDTERGEDDAEHLMPGETIMLPVRFVRLGR